MRRVEQRLEEEEVNWEDSEQMSLGQQQQYVQRPWGQAGPAIITYIPVGVLEVLFSGMSLSQVLPLAPGSESTPLTSILCRWVNRLKG